MIERIHLAILRELARQGSVTAAAAALHLTQSALSHSIKKLEQQAGTALWDKDGRSVRLTQAGSYLLSQAERLLPQFERLEQKLQQFASNEAGTLHIGMECHPCYQWLLQVVKPFLAAAPGMDIDVRQQFQFGGMAALFNQEIDLLITPDPIRKAAIEFEAVFPYELVLVVSKRHPLSQQQQVSAAQLSKERLLTYPVELSRLDIFQQFLLPAQCLPRQHKTLEDTDIILQMVAADRGVTALPDWLARQYASSLPLSLLRLGERGIQKHIYVGCRQQERQNTPIATFIQLAKGAVAPVAAPAPDLH